MKYFYFHAIRRQYILQINGMFEEHFDMFSALVRKRQDKLSSDIVHKLVA